MRRAGGVRRLIGWLLFALVVAAFVAPMYLVVTLALKAPAEVYGNTVAPSLHPQWGNFATAWRGGGNGSMGRALLNSLVITVGSVVPLLAFGSLCGYAIARRTSRLSSAVYVLVVVAITLPLQLAIIPLYVVLKNIGLLGSYFGVILLYVGILMPLSVFLYTGFIRVLPREFEEAAYVDGARLGRTLLRVVFPLLKPVTGTVSVLSALVVWNDFFVPLLFLSGTRRQPLPVAIFSFVGENGTQWNLVFAAIVVASVPMFIFFLLAQRQLVAGFAGGVKG